MNTFCTHDIKDSNQVTGELRYFTVTNKNGEQLGRYTGKTPKHAVQKAYSSLMSKYEKDEECEEYIEDENMFLPQELHVRNCSLRDNEDKVYSFLCTRKKLDQPESIVVNGQTIKYKYFHDVRKITNKSENNDCNNKSCLKEEVLSNSDEEKRINSIILKHIEDKQYEAAVKLDGLSLEYVNEDEQTEEICILAVKQNGLALDYVINQTEDICIAAVRQNGLALEYVKDQTENICIAAVRQNNFAVMDVKEMTDEICKIVNRADSDILAYEKWVKETLHNINMQNNNNSSCKPEASCEKNLSSSEEEINPICDKTRMFNVTNKNGELLGQYAGSIAHAVNGAFNELMETLGDSKLINVPYELYVTENSLGDDKPETLLFSCVRDELANHNIATDTDANRYLTYRYFNTITELPMMRVVGSHEL